VPEYLQSYEEESATILGFDAGNSAGRTVLNTWIVSLDKMRKKDGKAAEVALHILEV